MTDCPCRSGKALDACCGPYLDGTALAPTAEALMRSRYSAFATAKIDYLQETLLPETREDFNREEIEAWAKNSAWTGLEVRFTEAGGEEAPVAVKTIVREAPRVGRNDPCPCGSGKKYKKCHGAAA